MNLQGWTPYLSMSIPKHLTSKEDASVWGCSHDPFAIGVLGADTCFCGLTALDSAAVRTAASQPFP